MVLIMSSINTDYIFSTSNKRFFNQYVTEQKDLAEIKQLMDTQKKVEFVKGSWTAAIQNSSSGKVASYLLLGIPVLVASIRDFICNPNKLDVTDVDEGKIKSDLKEKISAYKRTMSKAFNRDCFKGGSRYYIKGLEDLPVGQELHATIKKIVVQRFRKRMDGSEEDRENVEKAIEMFLEAKGTGLGNGIDPKIYVMIETMGKMFEEELEEHFFPMMYLELKTVFLGDELKVLAFLDLLQQGAFNDVLINMGKVILDQEIVTDPRKESPKYCVGHSNRDELIRHVDLKKAQMYVNKLFTLVPYSDPSSGELALVSARVDLTYGKKFQETYTVKEVDSQETELTETLKRRTGLLSSLHYGHSSSRRRRG